MSREWRLYFDDLLAACEKVLSYTDGMSQEVFEKSQLTYDATLWNVQLFGEAAKNIPEPVRNQMPEVPWRELIGMRNHLVHGYFGINNRILWQVVSVEAPRLLQALENYRLKLDCPE
jgi:uncharacterized protein with HEPN domain